MNITTIASKIFIKENSLVSTKIEEINLNKDELGELKINITISGFSKKSDYSKITYCSAILSNPNFTILIVIIFIMSKILSCCLLMVVFI